MSPKTSRDWKPARRTLVVGLNWIGDTIMCMPAIEAWRAANPDAHLTVLVKNNLKALWELHSAPDTITTYADTTPGTWSAGFAMKSGRFERAVLFPNNFRSALIPFLAGIPERIGTAGQLRGALLTRHVKADAAELHQAYEYFHLLGLDVPERITPPKLKLSDGARELVESKLEGLPRPLIGLIPGAARGPSKRWPAEHFAEVGRRLASEKNCGIAIFGGPDDEELCESIRDQIGDAARSFAGKTSFKDWAAMLALCKLVVCNDSGGMHLAAAVGTPLIAIYGLTDPQKTGPLGAKCEIIRDETADASRDISRDSEAARKALAAIQPHRVLDATQRLL